jgi:hypothetical protein
MIDLFERKMTLIVKKVYTVSPLCFLSTAKSLQMISTRKASVTELA